MSLSIWKLLTWSENLAVSTCSHISLILHEVTRHSDEEGSAATSQLQGAQFDPEVRIRSVKSAAHSRCVYVSFFAHCPKTRYCIRLNNSFFHSSSIPFRLCTLISGDLWQEVGYTLYKKPIHCRVHTHNLGILINPNCRSLACEETGEL